MRGDAATLIVRDLLKVRSAPQVRGCRHAETVECLTGQVRPASAGMPPVYVTRGVDIASPPRICGDTALALTVGQKCMLSAPHLRRYRG